MIVGDLVAGDSVFVDSNILIYHFGPHPTLAASCSQLVQRIENLEIHGFTSSHVLGEVVHQLIIMELPNGLVGQPATSSADCKSSAASWGHSAYSAQPWSQFFNPRFSFSLCSHQCLAPRPSFASNMIS
jgi:hypothetical protein